MLECENKAKSVIEITDQIYRSKLDNTEVIIKAEDIVIKGHVVLEQVTK